jgi:catechol 2,3-dioxygenase-like lactoylglutathione lyase family enzyme
MLDHTGLVVSDLASARRFYEAIAAPLGLGIKEIAPVAFILGRSAEEPIPYLWIGTVIPDFWPEGAEIGQNPQHIAFTAPSRAVVDAFHAAGLAAGGRDNGAPGPRPDYGYYGAFLLDPDGHNIEACYHGPDALD